jgi:hypothetical protein
MPNLRVVYDNAADRATITASSSAGSLVPANLQTDYKSEVWRSTSLTSTLTLTWATAEIVGMFALAFASLTSAATFRIRGYQNVGDAVPLFDSTGPCCAGSDFDVFPWGQMPLGANGYSYGGGAYGVLWLAQPAAITKLVVDIVDTNQQGYIEASRAVCGGYWEVVNNAESGATVGVVDTSKQERTDAGDLRTDRGTVHKTLAFDLNVMPKADRDALYNILRGNGLFRPLYVSLTPADTDVVGEQVFQVYGKLSKQASIKYLYATLFSTSLEIEEL